MPAIQEYNSKEGVSGAPFEGAAYSMFKLGRAQSEAIQAGGNAVEKGINAVDQHVARSETNRVATDAANLHMQLHDQWNQTKQNADPNDPNVAKNFLEKTVQPALEKQFGDGFMTEQGQDAARKTSAQLASSWFEKTAADQAGMDAAAVTNAYQGVSDVASAAAQNDPASLHHQLDLIQTTIGPLADSHNAGAAAKEKLIRDASSKAVYAAALGLIDIHPEAAYNELTKPGAGYGYLDGKQIDELKNKAMTAQRMMLSMQKEQITFQKQQNIDAAHKAAGGIINNLIGPDGKVSVSPQAYQALKDPAFQTPEGAEVQKATLGFLQTQQSKADKISSNSAVFTDMRTRMGLPVEDPNHPSTTELVQAAARGDISAKDLVTLTKLNDMAHQPAAKAEVTSVNSLISGFKTAITGAGATGLADDAGNQRYALAQAEMLSAYTSGREAGKTHKDLTTPGSPDYIGNIAKAWILTPDQKMNAATGALSSGTTIVGGAPNRQGPAVGSVRPAKDGKDYRFNGGDPHDQKNWAPIGITGSTGKQAQQPVAETPDVETAKGMVKTAAAANGVPEDIAMAQIEAESQFGKNMKNPKEKIGGPGQLTQAFVKQYGQPGEDPKDFQTNLNIAMRGLKVLKDKKGTWKAALQAYSDPNDTTYADRVLNRANDYR